MGSFERVPLAYAFGHRLASDRLTVSQTIAKLDDATR